MRWKHGWFLGLGLAAMLACAPPAEQEDGGEQIAEAATTPAPVHPDSDPRAVEIARSVMETMGGRVAWDQTRFVSWNFFGRRTHYWDRATGDVRIEAPTREGDTYLILMNIHTRRGRAWKNGEPLEDPDELQQALNNGHEMWVNDSYWMFMPYKLLDPGVRLTYKGEGNLADGRPAVVLDLTFDAGVGYTPQNRYEVFVARDTGLVEQWAFFAEAANVEPNFVLPWGEWRRFGKIMLATAHGQEADWEIAVHDELPRSVFEDPAPVS